jgi:uncharacterized protein YndB with AHSA1/START domain
MHKEIKQTWFFNQPPQEVWEYLTKPELLEQWLMKTDFQPIVGHKFSFMTKPNDACGYDKIIDCQVLEIEPFTKISYAWKGHANNGKYSFDSKVIWTLIPLEGGTELQLVHNGFKILEDFVAHNNGWTVIGNRLLELLNATTNVNTNL